MRKFLLSIAAIAFIHQANAQVSITSIATPYTQNFDALSNDTANTAHAIGLTGWAIFEKGTSSAVDQMYKVNYGSKNAGDTYSYGDTVATDRAIGSLASGTNLPAFGVMFQNNTGASITDLTISFQEEQWRSGDTSTTLIDSSLFEYSTTATSIGDTAAAWNSVSSLMLNSLNMSIAIASALNGNVAPNKAAKTGSISVLIPNGGTIALRWRDINKAGSDDGLAVDDLTVNFSASGNPKPSIVGLTPMDDANLVSPLLTNLTMTFDQAVTLGTGNITVKNLSDVTQQTIACGATTIAGAVVTIPGVTLLSGKQYAVNFDSTCYTSSAAANSYGIYDNTSWNFATQPNGLMDVRANNLTLQMAGSNTLSFNMSKNETLTLSIYDMNGKTVSQQTVKAQIGENTLRLHNDFLVNGLYLIDLSNTNFKGSLKFEKQ